MGPAYAPIDIVYRSMQPLAPLRKDLRRILVCFGGVDQHNYTALALRALSHHSLKFLSVDVVLGASSVHYDKINKLVQCRPHTHLPGLSSLAGLCLRADLAIGAAGTSSWERVVSGVAIPPFLCRR